MEENKEVNILKDIAEIVKEDTDHNIKVQVAWDGITVYLDYDPTGEFKEETVIPVFYDVVDEFAYIPQKELRELYKDDEFGIDLHEIELISKIMKYLEENKKEIGKICDSYEFGERREKNEKTSLDREKLAQFMMS